MNAVEALGVAWAVAGPLVGIYIGYRFQESAVATREKEAVYDQARAIAMEVVAYLLEVEAHFAGGPEPAPLRADLGADFFRLLPAMSRASSAVRRAMDRLSDAVRAATGSLGITGPDRLEQRTVIMSALAELEAAANFELHAHPWAKLRKRVGR